jgi:transposase, IS5 family
LLAKAVRRIAATGRRIQAAGGATRTRIRDRSRSAATRALRRARTKTTQFRARSGHDPAAGLRRGQLARAVNDLTELLDATRQIAAQTRQRLSGVTPDGATQRVSLHDLDARPIAKGRLGKPVEFGHKAQVVDNDDGIVLDHTVEPGNPADAPRLGPAIERSSTTPAAHRARSPPTAATARNASRTTCTSWGSARS